MSNGKPRDSQKERFWRQTIGRWQKSGLTIRAFCRLHGLAESNFHAWRRTIANRDRVPFAAVFSRSRDNLAIGHRRSSQDSGAYVERGITWADSNSKRTREFAVTHFYPRVLFSFSNVMVFVHKNPRSGAFKHLSLKLTSQ